MKIEKYGIKMQDLKKAAGETKGLDGWNGYVQISYDLADGEVMAEYHVSVNDWTRYRSNSIISVCNAREPMTMQDIADAVALAIDDYNSRTF